ncbi:MAG: glycerol-3-phosphate 1-O-acyltransferase PlsY [Fusobacteriaceae bacterium]|nr:glycerol-3-phosphate 1-O-acyltransferase PlsY [Fusobacteriaceae bacterium]MBP6467038.1 glycerol-3-phosphate 1-O-acyltransferase PlsY [Fusobacteriaceae bacterium]
MLKVLIFVIISYLLGSLPNGLYVANLKGIDIRNEGSKNTGATNVFRVMGAKFGILVLILDALKGFIPLFIAEKFGVTGNSLVLIGITAVIGHTFSPFLNFKGGKGVATSLGIFLYLAPIPMLITLLMFFVVVGITKYVSLGSVLASVMLPLLILIMPVNEKLGNKVIVFIISALLGSYIIYKHRANIQRLKNGTENKFYKK